MRTTTRFAAAVFAAVLALSPGLAAGTAPDPELGSWPEATDEIVTETRAQGRTAALTFDDGPNPPDTDALLQVLATHEVEAVFCLWGDYVVEHPEVVRAIVAAGHTLCNHTMHHDDISEWSAAEVGADLRETNAAIRAAAPGARIPYFRAPYGAWGDGTVTATAAELDMQPLGWSLVVSDWETPGTEVLVDRILTGVEPGSVILLHDGVGDRSQTVEAVAEVIPTLHEQDWEFTLPAKP